MAPVPVTEDYYFVLEVVQTATVEVINRSYKQLALKLHPDRNSKNDATEAFQLLGRAYETLKDESKRREYDLIYPSITRSRPSQNTQTPRPSPFSTKESKPLSEAEQIAVVQKSKQERNARWNTKRNAFNSLIWELQRDIRRLEQEIKNLNSIVAAEVAEEAWKNGWTTWLLSPIIKKTEESEDDKAYKERKRQERRIEKDMKERRLGLKKADLKKEEDTLKQAKEEVDAADMVDNGKIRAIEDRIRARETLQRLERERLVREAQARIWKQQQEQWDKEARECAEMLRKQEAARQAAEQKRREEEIRAREELLRVIQANRGYNYDEEYSYPHSSNHLYTARSRTRQTSTLCIHDGWWPKVHGRKECPKCSEVWNYLLQCPSCQIEACPKCQSDLRPRRRSTPRTRAAPKAASPQFYTFDDDYY